MKNSVWRPIVLALVLLFSCKADTTTNTALGTKLKVQTLEASLKDVVPEISSFGSLTYIKKADVVAAVEGILSSQPLREGDFVSKGQVLAKLTNIQMQIKKIQSEAAVNSATANYKLAVAKWEDGKKQVEARFLGLEKSAIELAKKKKETENLSQSLEKKRQLLEVDGITKESLQSLELSYQSALSDIASLEKDIAISQIGLRDDDLLEQNLPVPKDLVEKKKLLVQINSRTLKGEVDVAEAGLTSAKTEAQSVDELLNELTIVSPLTGVVGARYMETGERVQAGGKLFTVFESGDAYVAFPIQENQVTLLKKGQKVDVAIDALPEKKFTATIDNIAPVIDPQSGNLTVKALLSSPDQRLRPGMFARVWVKTGDKIQRIVLPETVVFQKNESKAVVFAVKGDRVFKREITISKSENGTIEIEKGINPGEYIVNNPSPTLADAEQVEISHAP